MSKSVIIIPSRLSATRLPNKPLIRVNDKSLIMHVYEKAIKSNLGEVYVATCDEEIAIEVENNKGNYIMTSKLHKSGTDRVYEASKKLNLTNPDYIINIQGDEPMISPDDIKNLSEISKKNQLDMSTLAFNINDKSDLKNKNIVKVITNDRMNNFSTTHALTFKRIIEKNLNMNIYHHYGVYMYKASILEKIVKLKQTINEKIQNLEQLRALENNIIINVLLAKHLAIGIDTLQDLSQFTKLINNSK